MIAAAGKAFLHAKYQLMVIGDGVTAQYEDGEEVGAGEAGAGAALVAAEAPAGLSPALFIAPPS